MRLNIYGMQSEAVNQMKYRTKYVYTEKISAHYIQLKCMIANYFLFDDCIIRTLIATDLFDRKMETF